MDTCTFDQNFNRNFSKNRCHKRQFPRSSNWARALDLTIVLLALPLWGPVVAILTLITMLDGGPAIFRHPRIGRSKAQFNCLKLRTMVPHADELLETLKFIDKDLAKHWNDNQKLSEDPRLTRFGRVLRRTSLDELPQLINVVRGEMSLVGPRPITPDQLPEYLASGGSISTHNRPGLTGLWQVYARADTRLCNRARYDRILDRALSPGLYLKLIIKTIPAMLLARGA